ncbi:MAG: hypothetical protein ACRCXZ_00780 [Patescibacteria group bacterium]
MKFLDSVTNFARKTALGIATLGVSAFAFFGTVEINNPTTQTASLIPTAETSLPVTPLQKTQDKVTAKDMVKTEVVVKAPVSINTDVSASNSTQFKTLLPSVSFGFGGESAHAFYNFNVFDEKFSHVEIGGGRSVKLNADSTHVWMYLSKDDAEELVYSIKHLKNNMGLVRDLGGLGVISNAVQYNPITAYFGSWAAAAGAIYNHGGEKVVTDAERCIAKDSGMYLDAYGGILFLNPVIKCDK